MTKAELQIEVKRLQDENKKIKRISSELYETHKKVINELLTKNKELQENICNRDLKHAKAFEEQQTELFCLRLIKKQAEFIMRKVN